MKAFLQNIKSGFGKLIRKSYEIPLWQWLLVGFLLSIVEVVLLETLGRRSLLAPFVFIFYNPLVFLYNIVIVFFSLSFSLLFKRRGFVMCFIMLLWIGVGTINFVLLGYRITPFSAIDFLMFSDVLSMFNIYFNLVQRIAIVIAGIVFITVVVIAFLKTPMIKEKVNYIQAIIVILISFIVVYIFTFLALETSLISDKFTNLGVAYKNYGFVYCFSNSVIDQGISKPEGYSKTLVDSYVEGALETKDDVHEVQYKYKMNKKQLPDIIVVQLESFIDINRVSGIHTDKESIPNFKAFMEEYPSGRLTVPAIGAGTANSEFEILTGMKSKLFGAGEYPYKTILTEKPCESMAQILRQNGYGTHAIHNNKAKFYSRDVTYANLGFETFTSLEYMLHFNKTRTGWAKDDCLPEEIFKALDYDDKPDLVYTISVQGHGRYPKNELKCKEHVKVTLDKDDPELTNQFGYFVNQCYEMDQMVGLLKRRLDIRGRDYVLLLYGDHIPSLTFDEGQFVDGEENQTDYVIISSFDLGLEDRDLYAYEMSDYLLRAVGFTPGIMQDIHRKYFNTEVPDSQSLLDAAVQGIGGDSSNNDIYDYAVHNIEYDMLYGDGFTFNYIQPYQKADMRLGLYDITIDEISYNDSTGSLVVRGQNFTPFSKVLINDERQRTSYVDENTILVSADSLEKPPDFGDSIVVAQIDKDKHELSRTKVWFYQGE